MAEAYYSNLPALGIVHGARADRGRIDLPRMPWYTKSKAMTRLEGFEEMIEREVLMTLLFR